jgi:hypothetical protein
VAKVAASIVASFLTDGFTEWRGILVEYLMKENLLS